jgi:hypothetical protein
MHTPETNSNTLEHTKGNPEALEQAGHERRKELQEQLEQKSLERSPENGEQSARREALESAKGVERETMHQEERKTSPAERRHPISRKERDESFRSTMHEVQSQMDAPSRAFSKVIHNKAVERVSETTGNTIARPDALLSGAIFAFILTLAVYLVAKNIGYPLSGFESIGAFILGWIIGLIYDFLKTMTTGRK